jgi:ribosomal protein S24E
MDITVSTKKYNPFLKRNEFEIKIIHDNNSTPNRLLLKQELVSILKTDSNKLVIKKITTKMGMTATLCDVEVYDDIDMMRRTIPQYIRKRR